VETPALFAGYLFMTKPFLKSCLIMAFALWSETMGNQAIGSGKPDMPLADAKAFAAPTDLTATLADPINIDLKWKNHATDAAGYFVEYSPNLNGEFDIIAALPPDATSYRHPNLMPQTRFLYRVLPFFGKASNVAEITTGKQGPQQNPSPDLAKTVPPSPSHEVKKSVKSTLTAAEAAPTDLKATLIPPAGVKLEWKDHAKDEDGYLLEIKSGKNSDFEVSAFLNPGTTSLISYDFPFETTFYFRVRPFFYGKPSNLAEKTTGLSP